MLKPADPAPPGGERPIGELFHELVEDGKAYARAELNVCKAMASAKANAYKMPLILFTVAALVGMAALNALAVGIFAALANLMPDILAAIVAFLLIGGVAGLLGWLGLKKLRDAQ